MSNAKNMLKAMNLPLLYMSEGGDPLCFAKSCQMEYNWHLQLMNMCFTLLLGFLMAISKALELSIEIEKALLVMSTYLTA